MDGSLCDDSVVDAEFTTDDLDLTSANDSLNKTSKYKHSNNSMRERRKRLAQKQAQRKVTMNSFLNSSVVKKTLRTNNRDLAASLQKKRCELREARELIVSLRQENREMALEVSMLRRQSTVTDRMKLDHVKSILSSILDSTNTAMSICNNSDEKSLFSVTGKTRDVAAETAVSDVTAAIDNQAPCKAFTAPKIIQPLDMSIITEQSLLDDLNIPDHPIQQKKGSRSRGSRRSCQRSRSDRRSLVIYQRGEDEVDVPMTEEGSEIAAVSDDVATFTPETQPVIEEENVTVTDTKAKSRSRHRSLEALTSEGPVRRSMRIRHRSECISQSREVTNKVMDEVHDKEADEIIDIQSKVDNASAESSCPAPSTSAESITAVQHDTPPLEQDVLADESMTWEQMEQEAAAVAAAITQSDNNVSDDILILDSEDVPIHKEDTKTEKKEKIKRRGTFVVPKPPTSPVGGKTEKPLNTRRQSRPRRGTFVVPREESAQVTSSASGTNLEVEDMELTEVVETSVTLQKEDKIDPEKDEGPLMSYIVECNKKSMLDDDLEQIISGYSDDDDFIHKTEKLSKKKRSLSQGDSPKAKEGIKASKSKHEDLGEKKEKNKSKKGADMKSSVKVTVASKKGGKTKTDHQNEKKETAEVSNKKCKPTHSKIPAAQPPQSKSQTESDSSSSESETSKKSGFTAFMNKPGRITFTTGRMFKPPPTVKPPTSRSKQCSMLPKPPRARSKTRKQDEEDKEVKKNSQEAKPELKSVYDMSLNESVLNKSEVNENTNNATNNVPKEAPKEAPKDAASVKPSFKERLVNLNKPRPRVDPEPEPEQITDSPHGIMLLLGNGKRTKARSKQKSVSYNQRITEDAASHDICKIPADEPIENNGSDTIHTGASVTADAGNTPKKSKRPMTAVVPATPDHPPSLSAVDKSANQVRHKRQSQEQDEHVAKKTKTQHEEYSELEGGIINDSLLNEEEVMQCPHNSPADIHSNDHKQPAPRSPISIAPYDNVEITPHPEALEMLDIDKKVPATQDEAPESKASDAKPKRNEESTKTKASKKDKPKTNKLSRSKQKDKTNEQSKMSKQKSSVNKMDNFFSLDDSIFSPEASFFTQTAKKLGAEGNPAVHPAADLSKEATMSSKSATQSTKSTNESSNTVTASSKSEGKPTTEASKSSSKSSKTSSDSSKSTGKSSNSTTESPKCTGESSVTITDSSKPKEEYSQSTIQVTSTTELVDNSSESLKQVVENKQKGKDSYKKAKKSSKKTGQLSKAKGSTSQPATEASEVQSTASASVCTQKTSDSLTKQTNDSSKLTDNIAADAEELSKAEEKQNQGGSELPLEMKDAINLCDGESSKQHVPSGVNTMSEEKSVSEKPQQGEKDLCNIEPVDNIDAVTLVPHNAVVSCKSKKRSQAKKDSKITMEPTNDKENKADSSVSGKEDDNVPFAANSVESEDDAFSRRSKRGKAVNYKEPSLTKCISVLLNKYHNSKMRIVPILNKVLSSFVSLFGEILTSANPRKRSHNMSF